MDSALAKQRLDFNKWNGHDSEQSEELKPMDVPELVDSDKKNREFYRRREMLNY